MSGYLENVIKASGGYAAPAENLESKDIRESLKAAGIVIPEEQDLADALLEIVEKHGKFNDDNTGVWAGYDSAEKNAENATIGVKCGNCIFWEAPNGCKIIQAETEEGGLCRFAILPDGAVTADANYGGKCPPATQDIVLNIENRQNAIENVGYGPLNPAEPNEDFWQDKAARWDIEAVEAKKSICGNCVFFDRRPQTLQCIETGIAEGGSGDDSAWGAIDQAELGYCTALDFKCAASRTCNAWAVGGPITEDTEETMTATASANETALEKNEDDPCWSGYIQVGMKNKNGRRVPNCVPSASTIDYVVASMNEEFGPARHVSTEAAYAVARNAYEKYESLSDEEVYSAILWELMTYAEYATTGVIEEGEDPSEFAAYIPEGHPDHSEASLVASIAWVASAPDLDNSARHALLNAFSDTTDYVSSLHASTRLRAVVSSGNVSEATLFHIKSLSERYSKVN